MLLKVYNFVDTGLGFVFFNLIHFEQRRGVRVVGSGVGEWIPPE